MRPVPAAATSDSQWAQYGATNTMDENLDSFWSSNDTPMPHWAQLDLISPATVAKVIVRARPLAGLVVQNIDVATANGGALVTQATIRNNTAADITATFAPVTATTIRVTVLAETYNGAPRQIADLAEIELYDAQGNRID